MKNRIIIDKDIIVSELLAKELILDIFYQAVEEGVETISTREILHFLGCEMKKGTENIVFDLTKITRNNIAFLTDSLLNVDNIQTI